MTANATASALLDGDLAGYEQGPGSGGEPRDPYLGREISGHIEIRDVAGVGAMGRVYRAFQKGIDRDVAVKVLHRELSANQQLVARFHREAKVASRLQHPNVVQVHLAGQLPDGAMYIVMEYLDGVSLQGALQVANGPFPLQRALHIALQICDAAGEGHAQGVIHRDLKPENIMLVRRGDDPDFVKVLDFGIARMNWGEQSMATAAGLIFGTARYISPEGAQGEAVGPEGDVYATATLLYQMLSGRTPFEGEQAVALLIQQIHDAPPALRSIPAAAAVPEAIASVIMTNLSKTPGDRASDARVFGRALVEAAKSVGLTPEDLVPRSSLFVPHARLSDPGPPLSSIPPPVREARESRDERARESQRPEARATTPAGASGVTGPSQKTRLWNPPPAGAATATVADVVPESVAAAELAAAVPPPLPVLASQLRAEPAPPTPPPGQAGHAGPAYTSNVDRTLDESSDIRAPLTPPPRIKTEPALPLTAFQTPPPAPLASALALLTPPPPLEALTNTPPGVGLPPMGVSPLPTAPGALAGVPFDPHRLPLAAMVEEEPVPARRLVGVLVLCLLVGILGAAAVLYHLDLIGSAQRPTSADDIVAHADEALKHGRWDAPPGDNVRDLTNSGLARFPHEARLLDLRARATDQLVKEAVGRELAKDFPSALHLAHLANELDPTDTTAQHLVDRYEHASTRADAAVAPAVTGAAAAPPPHGSPTHPPTPPGAAAGRATIDASPPRPRVNQPIAMTAKVSGASGPAKTVDDARFVVNGPGFGADTGLVTTGSVRPAGLYSATFSGFEPGKYDVAFEAKVDGTPVRATKSIVIEGQGQLVPPPPSASAPSVPASVPSGKWL